MEERLCKWLTRVSQLLAGLALSMAVGVAVGRLSHEAVPAPEPLPAEAQQLLTRASQLASSCPSLRQSSLEFVREKNWCAGRGEDCLELALQRLGLDVHRCEQSLHQAVLLRQRHVLPALSMP